MKIYVSFTHLDDHFKGEHSSEDVIKITEDLHHLQIQIKNYLLEKDWGLLRVCPKSTLHINSIPYVLYTIYLHINNRCQTSIKLQPWKVSANSTLQREHKMSFWSCVTTNHDLFHCFAAVSSCEQLLRFICALWQNNVLQRQLQNPLYLVCILSVWSRLYSVTFPL